MENNPIMRYAVLPPNISDSIVYNEKDNIMKVCEVEYAERKALDLFDIWNDVTDCIPKFSSYYGEIQGVILDAVHCGIQMAINGEINIKDGNVIRGNINK